MRERLFESKFLNLVIAASFLGILLHLSRPEEILQRLGQTDILLYLSGLGVFAATYIPSTQRWRKLAGNLGYDISFRDSFLILAISYALNRVLPGNTGDLVRSKIEERFHSIDAHSEVLGGVTAERFWDVLTLTSIILLSGLVVSRELLMQYRIALGLLGLLIFSAALFVVTEFSWLIEKLEKLGRPGRIIRNIMEGYRQSSKAGISRIGCLSISKWLLEAVAFFLFAISIAAGLTFWEAALVTSVMTLVSSLPITPSGIGPVDAAGTALLVLLGLNYSAAFTLVIVQRSASIFLVAFIGGIAYLWTQ